VFVGSGVTRIGGVDDAAGKRAGQAPRAGSFGRKLHKQVDLGHNVQHSQDHEEPDRQPERYEFWIFEQIAVVHPYLHFSNKQQQDGSAAAQGKGEFPSLTVGNDLRPSRARDG
jgi:hypothetical protein